MAGSKRREVAQDSLAGRASYQAVKLSGPGVRAPNMPSNPQPSVAGQLAGVLGKWASEKLTAQANREHETSLLEGAMASVQGDTLDSLRTGGDKWAMEGHRVMTAQTISSTMVAARKQAIIDSDFALSADDYRAQFVGQLGQLVEGQDPRTAKMIREQMVTQMPALVAAQTVANMQYQEQQGYDALVRGIGPMALDPTAAGALVSFALGGEGSASAGLSDARRIQGTVDGIVLSYQNDNAVAYGILKSAGALENLNTQQLQVIEAADKRMQTRHLTEFSQALFDGEQAIQNEMKSGKLEPDAAVNAVAELYAQFGIDMTMQRAGAIYTAADTTYTTAQRTRAVLMQAAVDRGDHAAYASLTEKLMIGVESGTIGRKALGPVIEHGVNKGDQATTEYQVMPITAENPGFGIEPSDGTMKDNARVGKELWAMMIAGSAGSSVLKWGPMDLEAAAVAYNAGSGSANVWIDSGRDYDSLPDRAQTEDYVNKILKAAADQKAPTAQDALVEARKIAKLAKDALAVEKWEALSPRLVDADKLYTDGNLSEEAWLDIRGSLYDIYDVERTKAVINRERAITASKMLAINTADSKRITVEQKDQLALRMLAIQSKFDRVVEDASKTEADKAEALLVFITERDEAVDATGLKLVDQGNAAANTAAFKTMSASIPATQRYQEDSARIARAVKQGTVKGLKPALQLRAFDEGLAEIKNNRLDIFNLSEKAPEDEAALYGGMDDDKMEMWLRFGMVDPREVQSESNLILNMMDENGVVRDGAVGAMTRWLTFMEMDISGRVAATYLDEDARMDAMAIRDRMGLLGQVNETMTNFQNNLSPITREQAREWTLREQTQTLVADVVGNIIDARDVGWWQALFSGRADAADVNKLLDTERRALQSDETKDIYKELVSVEVMRLHMNRPGIAVENIVSLAEQNVQRNTDTFAGSVVTMNFDIKERFFGDRVSQFDKDGISNDVALLWMQSDAFQLANPGISSESWVEAFPRSVQEGISGGLFGIIGNLALGMSREDASRAAARGVRPYQVQRTADGRNMFITYLMDNGDWSSPIPFDMEAAGAYYMATQDLKLLPQYDAEGRRINRVVE